MVANQFFHEIELSIRIELFFIYPEYDKIYSISRKPNW